MVHKSLSTSYTCYSIIIIGKSKILALISFQFPFIQKAFKSVISDQISLKKKKKLQNQISSDVQLRIVTQKQQQKFHVLNVVKGTICTIKA